MKSFLQLILSEVVAFLDNRRAAIPIEPSSKKEIVNTLEVALYKKAAIHVIYGNRSFTGTIVDYDQQRGRLIMKQFERKMTSIIRVKDIKKVSIVPDSIKTTQERLNG